MAEYKDLLADYMKHRIKRGLESYGNNLPIEFKGLSQERLIYNIAEGAVPIMRMMEDFAIEAGIERFASGIRFARLQAKKQVK